MYESRVVMRRLAAGVAILFGVPLAARADGGGSIALGSWFFLAVAGAVGMFWWKQALGIKIALLTAFVLSACATFWLVGDASWTSQDAAAVPLIGIPLLATALLYFVISRRRLRRGGGDA